MLPNDNNDANTRNNDNSNNNNNRTSGWEARFCEHFVLNMRLFA